MSILRDKIIDLIRRAGPISFEQFMEMVLYAPGHGYYLRDCQPVGREGDFYTSSHMHPVFGALLGRQIEECWLTLGNPSPFFIVEMGAGTGHLANDMLSFLSSRLVYSSLRYVIVERNPHIRAHQQQLLKQHSSRIAWVDSIDALKEPVTGCFLSNELLDSFPVRVVQMEAAFEEIFVGEYRHEFVEVGRPCSPEVARYLSEFAPDLASAFRAGDRTEVNLQIWPWMESISAKLAEGFVLTIDYGYPAPDYYCAERNRGTLLCYSGHAVGEDPYQNIGEQDITAHVNFTSLKRWGEDVGLRTIGYCPQGTYLISLGLDEVLPELEPDSDSFASARIRNLILPEGMGESHKVLMQYKGERTPNLRGFALRNQTKLLT